MKKHIIYIAAFVAAALLQTSCYEDEGNYDYHAINSLEVTIPETKVRMPKEEAVAVTIVPEISQTLAQNEENLLFQWRKAKEGVKAGSTRMNDYEDYSTGKECTITVEPYESEDIGVMLVVTDRNEGTAWYQTGEVSIVRPFNPCWFVLQEKEGRGVLGAVEGMPEAYYILPDVFQTELKTPFPLEGKPLAVAARKVYGDAEAKLLLGFFGYKADPGMVVVTEKDAAFVIPSTLAVQYQSDKILFEPTLKGEPIRIDAYKMSTYGELYVDKGKAYYSMMDGFNIPYTVKTDDGLPSITTFGSYYKSLLFFDEAAHCFWRASAVTGMNFMNMRSSIYVRQGSPWSDQYPLYLSPVAEFTNEEDMARYPFNPNKVDASLKVWDIVTGSSWGNYAYAIAAPEGGSSLTVFKFDADSDPVCAAKYSVPLPEGVDVSKAKFAASYVYTGNLIFMASGNKFYRINLDRGQVTELYAFDDPSAQIACLKFKDFEQEAPLGMTVGLGVNTGGKGVVVELQLTVAGDVERGEDSVCIYEDATQPLATIVDITYNYE